MENEINNCHGCKWLDEVRRSPHGPGDGYCCHVLRSKEQREMVRRPDMKACELYKPGVFATRYETERAERVRRANMAACELYEKGSFATRWEDQDNEKN